MAPPRAVNERLGESRSIYTLNNIGSLEGTLQYYHHATPGEPLHLHHHRDHRPTQWMLLARIWCEMPFYTLLSG